MLTQTEVYRRLKTEIDKVPAIDTHVHLDPRNPLSPDLAEVLYYPNYLLEILTAGAPETLARNQRLPGKERVKALVPELARSRCSAHAWMLREVIKQAYGAEEEVTEGNWEELYSKAEELRRRPQRLRQLCELAGVSRILIHLPARPMSEAGCDEAVFAGLSDLSVPSVPGPKELAAFEKMTGASVRKVQDLADAAASYLKRAAALGQRGLRVNLSPGMRPLRPGPAALQAAFDRAAAEKDLSEDDCAALATFALDAAASGAGQAGMTVQVFLGGSSSGGSHLPSADQALVATLDELLGRYPNVDFDICTLSSPLTQALCVLSKLRPNCFLGGIWWYCQFPQIMSSTYTLRSEILPASKWSGFFSDARVAEWIIGKAALARKELSRSLAARVLDGYLAEEDALLTARQVLYETPRRLYRL